MGFAAMLVCPPVSAAINIAQNFCVKPRNYVSISPNLSSRLPDSSKTGKRDISFNVSSYPSYVTSRARTRTTSVKPAVVSTASDRHHWMVVFEKPIGVDCKEDIINYYVKTLETVLGSESEARKRIYDVSCESHFGFCCDMEENASLELARLPGVLSVRPDPDPNCSNKDYCLPIIHSGIESAFLFPTGSSKHWLVRMDKPGVEVVTKAQMVDFCVHILKKVLGNERDAQMCIYHISWQSNFGFCCELDKECAQELAGVPGVISVQPDENFESSNKDYGGYNPSSSTEVFYSSGANQSSNMRTKKLFVTGLSFYTSEKTLRAAFEGFGELVEVRIIMDKISKRSKGYGFVEYTTEEAARAALKEMNGKIINGWMIIVDVAKSNPPKYIRGQPRPQQLPV